MNEPKRDGYLLLLFLSLSALLVLAAAHLLETVCYAVGPVGVRFSNPAEGEEPVTNLHLVYRSAVACVFLFLGYNCIGLREWARRLLVAFLVFDLVSWVVWKLNGGFLENGFSTPGEGLAVQLCAVATTGFLVWLLLQPGARRHFAFEPKKGKIVLP